MESKVTLTGMGLHGWQCTRQPLFHWRRQKTNTTSTCQNVNR